MSNTLTETSSFSPAVSRQGIQLNSLGDLMRFAEMLVRAGLAPKSMNTPEACAIAIQMGFEVGLPQMASIQNIAVINGRPSIWGDAQLAIVRSTGELEEFSEWYEQGGVRLTRNPTTFADDTTAVCRVKRRGYAPVEQSFSVADAKRSKLWGKQGPWTEYPARMLKSRARSFTLRDEFGDALRGILSVEEAEDTPEIRTTIGRDVTPPAGQVASSNPLKTIATAPVAEAEPVEVAASEVAPAPVKTFVNDADERASLSFDIREVIKEAEITLPRFEGMAKTAGFMAAEEALSGGKLSTEKLRIVHANRRVIAGLDEPAAEAPAPTGSGEEVTW